MTTAKPRAFISRKIPQPAIDIVASACEYAIWDNLLAAPRELFLQEASRSDGVLVMPSERINDELLDTAPRCKVVCNMAVGYDNIDVPALTKRGVIPMCGIPFHAANSYICLLYTSPSPRDS